MPRFRFALARAIPPIISPDQIGSTPARALTRSACRAHLLPFSARVVRLSVRPTECAHGRKNANKGTTLKAQRPTDYRNIKCHRGKSKEFQQKNPDK